MAHTLPDLPYAYDALAPHMSVETLEFHHDKHHNAYLTAMNGMIDGTDYASMSLEDMVVKSFSDTAMPGLFNQAGQFYNHIHFWNWMKPNGGGKTIPGALEKAINDELGGYD
ncbi:MAG: superoxide dismutase, partial [Pseudomonadota bacterium]